MADMLSGGVLDAALSALNPRGGWFDLISAEFGSDTERYRALDRELTRRYENGAVNPGREHIFRAFSACPLERVRVVICGQDPYPNAEHAMGLSFSVPDGTKKLPPSLKNILTELESDVGAAHGCDLTNWAEQGVLLLNTVLTVDAGNSNSHKALWGNFATKILESFNQVQSTPVAYILWGKQAQDIGKLLQKQVCGAPREFICSPHPSPLSSYRGFFGSKPFSKANIWLKSQGAEPIDW